jgi:hypothetical protein
MKYTPENGIRILARMIAEAYLEELDKSTNQQNSTEKEKEDCNANQGCDRGSKASPPGENKAGN